MEEPQTLPGELWNKVGGTEEQLGSCKGWTVDGITLDLGDMTCTGEGFITYRGCLCITEQHYTAVTFLFHLVRIITVTHSCVAIIIIRVPVELSC
jgi:hypothetical protein